MRSPLPRDGKAFFAGGDLQTGPAQAIMAIAAGREAACSMERFLDGEDMAAGRKPLSVEDPEYRPIPQGITVAPRKSMPELAVIDRAGNFREVELGYDAPEGQGGSQPVPQLRLLLRMLPVRGGLQSRKR